MKNLVIHPFFFAYYPVLYLYIINMDRVPFDATYRIAVIQLMGTLSLFLILTLISKNIYRAGLVTSLAIILFSSYGHTYNFLSGKQILGFSISGADIIAAT